MAGRNDKKILKLLIPQSKIHFFNKSIAADPGHFFPDGLIYQSTCSFLKFLHPFI
jgi:hypothetical protein